MKKENCLNVYKKNSGITGLELSDWRTRVGRRFFILCLSMSFDFIKQK